MPTYFCSTFPQTSVSGAIHSEDTVVIIPDIDNLSTVIKLFRHHHLNKFFIVDLTITINISFSDHFVDFFIRQFFPPGPPALVDSGTAELEALKHGLDRDLHRAGLNTSLQLQEGLRRTGAIYEAAFSLKHGLDRDLH